MTNGIDISKWQGKNIDFDKVKSSGIDFVIIRAGYGKSNVDECFEINYTNAKKAGLNIGTYWYSYATTVKDAEAEAETCLKTIKNKTFEYPIFYDIEEKKTFSTGKTDEMAKAFLNKLENAGYFAGIYISRSPAQTYLSEEVRKRYALWLAEYSKKLNYNGNYGIWQYSAKGKINGISGNVDLDYSYVDYPKIIKSKGLNGFTNANTNANIIEQKNVPHGTFEETYSSGTAIKLNHANLYISAYAKDYTRQLTGVYYIYDGKKINGRYRITTEKRYCGQTPMANYVTGFINL